MQEIPVEVRDYLSSNDVLYRHQILQRHPDLPDLLAAPETRTAILNWLASDEAFDESKASFVMRCLEFLHSAASEEEASTIKSLLLHSNSFVRLRAYEFLLQLYFPDKNREAMFLLLHNMLTDPDEGVRASGVSYIERAGAAAEFRDFLQRWIKVAISKGWENTESYQLVERLLAQ